MTDLKDSEPLIGSYSHGETLSIMAASRPARIKACAEALLDGLGDVDVLVNRTGLAMLPMVDTVRDTAFHLGEVLLAEAHIRVPERNVEGYGAVIGRDLEHAMAIAVIDAAIAAEHSGELVLEFLDSEKAHQEEGDRERLRKVEATRVQMETF
ncbi:alpha-D-ribose 1-methylphosphonate 5-triphosphate synthase subunit PhnG [Rhizobium petrolearium]|uniref:phosphonate C-P lyase system protein PhnG n=1 Tax=Neorhizobium petrolearium TaxID=515361 RepID=UPI001AE92110|nr:phosphonate C-P lyase system protein PhnG [Neorhizobium petrolearium]MBP1843233.1 alpha-D-ribose 1-methylphosphonate 5-triphosphate synthase subunit PhnG [Neorhizobium petrolearium]